MIQINDAIIVNKKIRYLDPLVIWEVRHTGPSKWKENNEVLLECKTWKEKNGKRKYFHK